MANRRAYDNMRENPAHIHDGANPWKNSMSLRILASSEPHAKKQRVFAHILMIKRGQHMADNGEGKHNRQAACGHGDHHRIKQIVRGNRAPI